MRLQLDSCVLTLALLAGCAHAPKTPAPAAQSALAPPGAVGARSASQVIHAAYGAHAVVLRTAIEVNAGELKVVGVTATGQRLFTVSYDGKEIHAEKSRFVPADLDPARMLSDVELALWPLAAVQTAFRERGLAVSEPFAGVRRLMRGDRLIAEVHYASADPWAGRLWFVNFEFDYSLTIDTSPSN
jgi:hypothetical protein